MTEEYAVIYSPEAKEDLFSIYRYIAHDLFEPKIAENQVNRIRNSIKKLGVLPERHKLVDWEPWSSLGTRSFVIDNFIVYYLVNQDYKFVSIIRILYGGRNVEAINRSNTI